MHTRPFLVDYVYLVYAGRSQKEIGLTPTLERGNANLVLFNADPDFRLEICESPLTLDPPHQCLPDLDHNDFSIKIKFSTMLYHPEQHRSPGSQRRRRSYLHPRGSPNVQTKVVSSWILIAFLLRRNTWTRLFPVAIMRVTKASTNAEKNSKNIESMYIW